MVVRWLSLVAALLLAPAALAQEGMLGPLPEGTFGCINDFQVYQHREALAQNDFMAIAQLEVHPGGCILVEGWRYILVKRGLDLSVVDVPGLRYPGLGYPRLFVANDRLALAPEAAARVPAGTVGCRTEAQLLESLEAARAQDLDAMHRLLADGCFTIGGEPYRIAQGGTQVTLIELPAHAEPQLYVLTGNLGTLGRQGARPVSPGGGMLPR